MRIIDSAKSKLTETRKSGFTLEFRFLITLIMLLTTLLLAAAVVFAATGLFDINKSQTAALFNHELSGLTEQVKTDYSAIASHAINLSDSLTLELEQKLDELSLAPRDIQTQPDALGELLRAVYPTLSAEIRALRSSGVYIILDATINPELPYAKTSRAGIFLKNISAQNNTFSSHYDLRYLRGPLDIGRNHMLTFLPQWQLEFDTSDLEYYNIPFGNAKRNPELSLSQQYYWSPRTADGAADYGMYCSVPLIASDGTVMGICGFEINIMQFRLAYTPAITGLDYAFCMLAPADSDTVYFDRAMFAGNYAVTNEQPQTAVSRPQGDGFLEYDCGSAGVFVGSHASLHLYPDSSQYRDNEYLLLLLTPQEQISRLIRNTNLRYLYIAVLLLSIGTAVSIVLCKRNIKPIKRALSELRDNKKAPAAKTRIREIDDLFDYLSELDREREEESKRLKSKRDGVETYDAIDTEKYELFVLNLCELTAKEREVFDLYMRGMKARDIADILGIAQNTVKYHNRNIYDKLGVSSRNELVLYANKMREDDAARNGVKQ